MGDTSSPQLHVSLLYLVSLLTRENKVIETTSLSNFDGVADIAGPREVVFCLADLGMSLLHTQCI